jgi:hypothetical protein
MDSQLELSTEERPSILGFSRSKMAEVRPIELGFAERRECRRAHVGHRAELHLMHGVRRR